MSAEYVDSSGEIHDDTLNKKLIDHEREMKEEELRAYKEKQAKAQKETDDDMEKIKNGAAKVINESNAKEKKGPMLVIGESISLVGTTTVAIVRTGILFMAFYTLWAWSGMGLFAISACLLAVGLLIWYLGNGLAGHGWNPLNQLENRKVSKANGNFSLS